jgi:hypothetical protein
MVRDGLWRGYLGAGWRRQARGIPNAKISTGTIPRPDIRCRDLLAAKRCNLRALLRDFHRQHEVQSQIVVPMKTLLGAVSFTAALVSLAPAILAAEKSPGVPGIITSSPSLVNRSIERLTLLPGPYLLSPARTTPTMAPAPMKLQTLSNWTFVPGPKPEPTVSAGSLRLVSPKSVEPARRNRNLPPPARQQFRPPPETLRFDTKLESTLPRS